jgi:hypothetical protein
VLRVLLQIIECGFAPVELPGNNLLTWHVIKHMADKFN